MQLDNKLVGNRFTTIQGIELFISKLTNRKVNIFESETDAYFLSDYQLDGEFDEEEEFSLWYIKDTKGQYYITETTFPIKIG